MQTILGAGGAVGNELAKALGRQTDDIRLVSRTPRKVNPADQLFSADLTRPAEVLDAVKGSDIVYLTVGLPYSTKVWRTTWPEIMESVIAACKTYHARLVFFDNMYMYDPDYLNGMTEQTPVRPVSEKGAIRARLVEMVWNEVENGSLSALIARSADFYGPGIDHTSMLTETVFKNLSKGKKANWLGSAAFRHSFTFTPDAGKATALLGNTAEAYNQTWHLPTAPTPFTGKQWIQAIAKEMGVAPRYQVVPKFLARIIGLFVPIMKEMVEMIYQYERDYVFSSDKFEKRFGFKPTPYLEGIRHIVENDGLGRSSAKKSVK